MVKKQTESRNQIGAENSLKSMKEASKPISKRGGTSCAASIIKDKGLFLQKKIEQMDLREKQFTDFKN